VNRPVLTHNIVTISLALASAFGILPFSAAQTSPSNQETIVLVRHGEKPATGLGQLTCKGLNRSLALPSLLVGRYGRPDFIFAPNPSVQLHDGTGDSGPMYSYVRPLATIEPTAIRLGMPVNTQIGFNQIAALQQELLQPSYAHSLIFVAWEHIYLHKFALQLLQSYGDATVRLPDWPNSEYETIYIFHVTRTGKDDTPHVALDIQTEGLSNTLSDACPGPQ
jgi:hypothetical protein